MNNGLNGRPVPPDEDTAAALKLWVIMSRAQRAIGDRIRTSLEAEQLHPTEFGALEILYHKGELTIGEIGAGVLISSGNTTHVVNKLEKRGLVQRRSCSTDGRIFHVGITDEGAALMQEYFPRHAQALRQAMSGLTAEEKKIAAVLLKRLGTHLPA